MTTNESKPVPYTVTSIVGRCHVGHSNRQVIWYFISRLKDGYNTWRVVPKAERKQWLRWIVQAHAENRSLYNHVMRGY
jgi:hypothetical protein